MPQSTCMSTVARRRAVARPTHASAAVIGGNDCTGHNEPTRCN